VIPLASATSRILAAVGRLHPRAIPLDDALGCVTSVPLFADEAVPPFANTAMDGFAVRAADTVGAPVRLRVVGTLAAGMDPAGMQVGAGEAIRIMTGAPVPDGADAVVMVERTSTEGDEVVVEIEVPTGNHVRPSGEDLAPGQEVFPAFTVLSAGHLGVLASLGMRKVPVFPRARVGVLSTGDELIDGPGDLRPGQIRDSNRHTLLALARDAGCEPVDLGIVRDDEAAVRAAIEQGVAEHDALITTGGVSMGDFDEVKKVLTQLSGEPAGAGGAGEVWMQVAIKPAKPLAFAMVGEKPVFGLPGNPASSMVSFELFARPALRQLMGHPSPKRTRIVAVADEPFARRPDGKLHLVRVVATFGDDGRCHVRSAGGQASNLLRSMALANALAFVPDGDGIAAGGEVQVVVLTYP
jgi:molybdenum cofactor synthesis domain-containing protein